MLGSLGREAAEGRQRARLWYTVAMNDFERRTRRCASWVVFACICVAVISGCAQERAAAPEPVGPPPLVREGAITRWDEGMPLGNGLLGALVWGEGNVVRISLDRGDLWDTRMPETLKRPEWTWAEMVRLKKAGEAVNGGAFHQQHQELFDVPYDTVAYPTKLPGGRVELRFADDVKVESFALMHAHGMAAVKHSRGTLVVWIERGAGGRGVVLVDGPMPEVTIVRPRGLDALKYAPAQMERAAGSGEGSGTASMTQSTAEGWAYCVAAEWDAAEGRAGGSVRLALETGESAERARSLARSMVSDDASREGWLGHALADLMPGISAQVHANEWQNIWRSSSVTIPDARLQQQYDLCRYFYAAASRPGSPPMPLQGLWTADEGGLPPWKGDYHHDLNTQMTYLAYHDAGLREEGMSFVNQLWELKPRFERFALEFYGLGGQGAGGTKVGAQSAGGAREGDRAFPGSESRGAAGSEDLSHRPSPGPFPQGRGAGSGFAPLVVPGVMGIDGAPLGGWGQYSLMPTHTAWLAQTFYLHWKYTASGEFLASRAYPWCSGAGEALLALLERVEVQATDGARRTWLRLPVSTSPEIHDNSYAAWLPPNTNYDLSLMRWLFGALDEMARAMGDEQAAARWREVLAMLEPLDVDATSGALTFARGHPYAQSHRHFSHAMEVYPLGTLTIEGSDADRRTIAATIDQLDRMGTDWWCGYSFSWMSAMCARAGQPERALEYLTKYLAFTGPNGFHLNGDQTRSGLSKFTYRPFTLEGNFLAMQAVHEMLLQSWGGTVRVFPATSERWADASFRDLCAQGGLRVSAERRGGKTVHVSVRRESGAGEVRVRDPFAGRGVWTGGTGASVRREGGDVVAKLPRGGVLVGRSAEE